MVALPRSDLRRLLESPRSPDGLELVRGVAEGMFQEPIEVEVTTRIGVRWKDHTDTRTAVRNGRRDKTPTNRGR